MSNRWTQQDIPGLTGKVVIITGANSGLGLESTKALAAKGATVVMACRNLSKAEAAKGGVFYGPKTMRLRGYPAEQKCNDAVDDALASLTLFTSNIGGWDLAVPTLALQV